MLFDKITLDEDEIVLQTVHRHWFVLLSRVLGVIFAALLPIIFIVVATNYVQLADYISIILFVAATWLLYSWMILAYLWTDDYLDILIITNHRVVKIDQRGLFHRSVGTFRLERLQDVNIEINGFIATFLEFGNIEAQTASGSEEEFQAFGLPNPRDIKVLILEATNNRMRELQ